MPDGPPVLAPRSGGLPEPTPDGQLYGRTNNGTVASWQLCVPTAGGVTMTGLLVLSGPPTVANGAATRDYADAVNFDDGTY